MITDGFDGYVDLGQDFRHYSVVQGAAKNAETILPVIHVLFSNIKAWLNGTFHGSAPSTCRAMPRSGPTGSTAAAGSMSWPTSCCAEPSIAGPSHTASSSDGLQPQGAIPVSSG